MNCKHSSRAHFRFRRMMRKMIFVVRLMCAIYIDEQESPEGRHAHPNQVTTKLIILPLSRLMTQHQRLASTKDALDWLDRTLRRLKCRTSNDRREKNDWKFLDAMSYCVTSKACCRMPDNRVLLFESRSSEISSAQLHEKIEHKSINCQLRALSSRPFVGAINVVSQWALWRCARSTLIAKSELRR